MREWTDGFVHANGIAIHYHRTGGDKKPPLILLHGVTDSGLCWPQVAHDLQDEYDVFLPDARGHGRSSGVETGFSYEILAQDVLAFMDALKLEKPLLFGHSMGAMTALVAASSSDEVKAIVLEDPPLRDAPPMPINAENRQNPWQWVYEVKALSDEERKAMCRIENPNWAEEEIGPWSASKAAFNTDVLKYSDAFLIPWRKFVPSITCPVLLITGDTNRGAIVTPETAQEMAHLCKQGMTVHIDGAGHNIHRDRYDATMAAVRAFFNKYG